MADAADTPSPPPPTDTGWLFVSAGFQPRAAHFAGGDHGLWCMARTLAARGAAAHLLFPADKSAVMAAAVQGGFLLDLGYSPFVKGVTTWRQEGVTVHAVLRDEDAFGNSSGTSVSGSSAASPSDPGPVLRRLLQEGAAVVGAAGTEAGCAKHLGSTTSSSSSRRAAPGGISPNQNRRWWVVLDSDGAQQPQQNATAGAGSTDPSPASAPASLLEAAVALWGRRVLVLVQNVHFLPFGPEGTCPRTPAILQAWGGVGGAFCPSHAVARYLSAAPEAAGLLQLDRVCVVPYAAWGAYGEPPFEDVGARVAGALQRRAAAQRLQQQPEEEKDQGAGQEEPPPVLALKLNREKGSDLFLALAHRLPSLRFLAVTGDGTLPPQQRPHP